MCFLNRFCETQCQVPRISSILSLIFIVLSGDLPIIFIPIYTSYFIRKFFLNFVMKLSNETFVAFSRFQCKHFLEAS